MKVTNFGPGGLPKNWQNLGGGITSVNSNFNTTDGGLTAVNFVQRITANSSNVLLNPIVNFASGSNILLTLDQGPLPAQAMPSNTIRIHSTAGGAGNLITSNGSNSLAAVINLQAGSGIALGVSGQDITITNTGSGGGGGSSSVAGKVPVNVGSATQTSSSSTLSVTITAAASGNLLIATISGVGTANVSSISSTNTTWSVVKSSTAGSSPKAEIWKGVVSGGSSGTTVTVTFSANNSDRSAVISEWNGITGTVDQTADNSVFATTATTYPWAYSPTILPTNKDALVVACIATANGTNRMGLAGQLTVFAPVMANTASLAGYQMAAYGFPGTTPVSIATYHNNTTNISAVIASLT